MLVIGVTGGIGTGKTAVTHILKELGADIIGADDVGHEAYNRGTKAWREVVDEFGEDVLAPDGEVDRGKLGSIVFDDEGALERLNAIVHPRIRSMIEERVRELRERGSKVAVVEAALLLEAGWESLADEIWVTVAPGEKVLERVRNRSDLDVQEIRARVLSQMPQRERLADADAVIDNGGSLDDLRQRVRTLWHERVNTSRKHNRRK